jgi:serine phosphatase RsbU (regulator of sigma subunit)/putative methionine-R-sulfoxide reductase with GAF domain
MEGKKGLSEQSDRISALPGWKTLLQLGEKLVDQPTISAQKEYILQTIAEITQAKVSLWFAAPAYQLPGLFEHDLVAAPDVSIALEALQTRQAIFSADPSSGPGLTAEEAGRPLTRSAALPLLSQDTLLGVLLLERVQAPYFRAEEEDFLQALAGHVAVALQVTRQVILKNWRFEQLALVRSVSFQIANVNNLDELSRRITNLILHTFQYYFVAIFTVEPGQELLQFRASALARPGSPAAAQARTNVRIGEGMVGHVALTGQELVAGSVAEEPHYLYLETLPETQSEVALPLKVEQRVLGVLDIQSDQPGAFNDMDMLVFRALADNIALAVEGARLYETLRLRADQLSTVAELGRAITAMMDVEELHTLIADLIHKRLGYPMVHIFTVHPGRQKIFYQAGVGARSAAMKAAHLTYDLNDPQGIIPWAARHNQAVVANDVSQDARYRPGILYPETTCSEMTIPLSTGGEVIGILDLQSDLVGAFSADDRTLMDALADNISIALRNTQLYRSERWRRQVAESLRDVAGILSSSNSLDQVLDAVLTELERNLPCEIAGIWLREDGDSPEAPTGLRLAAIHGATAEQVYQIRQLEPEVDPWFLQALAQDQPTIRTSQDLYSALGLTLEYPLAYSSIAAPLYAGSNCLGLLVLSHSTAGRYGSEARTMTAAFAGYAAVAIENARLFASSQEQAWISTVLLQVAEATQSLSTIPELTETIVRLTPLLVGVQSCAIFLWEAGDQAFHLNAAYGMVAIQPGEYAYLALSPIDYPAFAHLLTEKALVVVHDPVSELGLPAALAAALGTRAQVVLPLVGRTNLLGALLVTQKPARPGKSMAVERQSILQGIAQQTAIAIENIRLLDAKQEEAYVTAVLLQVAQAAVTMQDLDDVLESIVNIMPILVGIDRCVIFLWEERAQRFIARHAHAVSQESSLELCGLQPAPGEFPLLDQVWERDEALICLLEDSRPDMHAWHTLRLPEAGAEPANILSRKQGLLFGLPLSAKGERFGVLLAEDQNLETGFRERRMEILTGIAQQTALAIQNERVNRQILERERLEREFQLAREIQQTFLPDELPALPGWDLDARWRTARQVGGDFYDVFELEGNRLGLVIADVSDKGMAAALYMTVTRTLIRSTAHLNPSPANVLEQVNHLLTMNSANGMFVTAIYAIVELETGRVIYANAGHNLPLQLHAQTGQIEVLRKGGMALGVLDEIHIMEQQANLASGDCLVLYTDGVTETFAPTKEMYGEERLYALLGRCAGWGSREILDLIDGDINEFRQAEPVGDDITLLALHHRILPPN